MKGEISGPTFNKGQYFNRSRGDLATVFFTSNKQIELSCYISTLRIDLLA